MSATQEKLDGLVQDYQELVAEVKDGDQHLESLRANLPVRPTIATVDKHVIWTTKFLIAEQAITAVERTQATLAEKVSEAEKVLIDYLRDELYCVGQWLGSGEYAVAVVDRNDTDGIDELAVVSRSEAQAYPR